jgi:Arc/MetJ-type ribon-helix-helix transcriptional regulator
MKIQLELTPDQEAWLSKRVEVGDFGSVDEAASHLIDEAIADASHLQTTDLSWAKPLLDEAYASLERGEGSPASEAMARIRARLAEYRQ